mgnify:FL=1
MIEYNEKDFPNLYNEILKDYHYRFPKFYDNPYPIINNEKLKSETNQSTKRGD